MSRRQLKVFVSSKMAELAKERIETRAAIARVKTDAIVFERNAGSRPTTIQETYLKELDNSDLYLGIFWNGYGEYTVEELEHAREQDKDLLIFEKRTDIERRD